MRPAHKRLQDIAVELLTVFAALFALSALGFWIGGGA